ncbi:hypothetical protein MGN70_009831 [Eutypa lata]|uniref:Dolichyl-diphosphooligosaccharide--protein glycosyltransferase subunit OST2 n=1 Tax=Eutypa lata (strain UCR-EL1) TaxID=1287681 RepID=M7SVV3_EUTLA|nr:putative defender against cell death 1 protein [Eutypa lata UCREL1]KAI1248631.1 hypothetical protein MGN70_009831 [Eutypa lata]
MAKKSASAAAAAAAPTASTTTADSGATSTTTTTQMVTKGSASSSIQQTIFTVIQNYQKTTPQRTKLLDAFLGFIAVVGALQFVYCVLAGNFPFNAFLSGFSATVGQFVLTVSLRIQTTEANKAEFPSVSPERAFADYVVGSLILHFFCINFIN